MRFDLISIFPQYFAALELSLLGKAQDAGLVQLHRHDLREWTTDRHRTVDDTPYGGGAGMVMRPDIWGKAIDHCRAQQPGKVVLAVPTPSGQLLDQRLVTELAETADQIIIACGRYEGIDYRVVEHYQQQPEVEVLEYSLGDYILNGGEVAAVVLVEAVSRLITGVLGNPESLVEESHGTEGLLEYPAYTKPPQWRDLGVPAVLTSGNHGAVARWRRDQALRRTAQRRPDLALKLDPTQLDRHDREILASEGILYTPELAILEIREAEPADAQALSALAGRTFPMACPPEVPLDAVQRHIETQLNPDVFTNYLENPGRYRTLLGEVDGQAVGYTMTIVNQPEEDPEDPGVAKAAGAGALYLSKIYARAEMHGSGLAGALLQAAIADARVAAPWAKCMGLGTHAKNKRAQRFYRNHGFALRGRRRFDVGGNIFDDVVMVLDLTPETE